MVKGHALKGGRVNQLLHLPPFTSQVQAIVITVYALLLKWEGISIGVELMLVLNFKAPLHKFTLGCC